MLFFFFVFFSVIDTLSPHAIIITFCYSVFWLFFSYDSENWFHSPMIKIDFMNSWIVIQFTY